MRAIERMPSGWPDVLVAPDRGSLLRAIGTAQRRGELGAVGPLLVSPEGCYVRVVRLRMARRRRTWWPWVAGAIALAIAGLMAAGWFLAPWLTRTLPVLAAVTGFRLAARWFR